MLLAALGACRIKARGRKRESERQVNLGGCARPVARGTATGSRALHGARFQKGCLWSADIDAADGRSRGAGEVGCVRSDQLISATTDGRINHRLVFRGVEDTGPVDHVNRSVSFKVRPDKAVPAGCAGTMLEHVPFDFGHAIADRDESPPAISLRPVMTWDNPGQRLEGVKQIGKYT